ncbi:MAG: ABC transporter substrate-binding protein [Holosporaceae bacterium]|jgi:ABC-type transporter MlaC component|nr:ABC transporter substrate-binding protein [Holosporaceae bacterium]
MRAIIFLCYGFFVSSLGLLGIGAEAVFAAGRSVACPPSAVQQPNNSVKEFVENTFKAILRTIQGNTVNTNELIKIVEQNFAVNHMLSRVLGQYLNTLKHDPEKLKKFTESFIRQIVGLYKSELGKYKSATFRIIKIESSDGDYHLTAAIVANSAEITVELDITHDNGNTNKLLISRLVINDVDIAIIQQAEARSSGTDCGDYVKRIIDQYSGRSAS